MRTALVNPPAAAILYGAEKELKSIIPCLGLFYIQAYCRDVGEVRVFEGEHYPSIQDLIEAINEFAPDILGVTTNTSTYPLCVLLATSVKADLKVAGGPYAAFRVEESLGAFDAVALGFGEEPMRMLMQGITPSEIPGLALKGSTGVLKNSAPSTMDLDAFPFPDRSLMRMDEFQASPHRLLPEPWATMVTTRGCGFRCSFCLSAKGGLNGGRFLERSIENVLSEVEYLVRDFGVRGIQFWDDTFTMRKRRTLNLLEGLEKFDIAFVCNTRSDKVDDEIAAALKRSGCQAVFIGVETGDTNLLENEIHKGVRNEQVEHAVETLHAHGIETTCSFIFGSPGDTDETILATLEFAKTLNSKHVLFNIYTPHPGTEGYHTAVSEGLIEEYRVDLERWVGEPAGVPTVCRSLSRDQLHAWKARAYVEYLEGQEQVDIRMLELYQRELASFGG